MDEDEECGWSYKYHAKIYRILNKPYELWGTYYTIDMTAWKKDLEGSGWDDYDEFGKAYWENNENKNLE
jgi:hypothetical protein